MFSYILRRLLLLPPTLLAIIVVNFVIINLAPGDPVTVTEISQEGGATRKEEKAIVFGNDERYLHFREHYGLTLPVLFNTWPWMSQAKVLNQLQTLVYKKPSKLSSEGLSLANYEALRLSFGDSTPFIMDKLIAIISDKQLPLEIRQMALRFFVRGGTRQAYLGPHLTKEQKRYNRKLEQDSQFLENLIFPAAKKVNVFDQEGLMALEWYQENISFYHFAPSFAEKVSIFFFQTRFWRYMSRVLTLDFGTLRNDNNKSVIYEVTKRLKYSLTLALIPLVITFFLCQIFAFIMALKQRRWPDYLLNIFFLFLYAIPIFVVAPFLIDLSLNRDFPFTNTPIPLSGFTSPETIYDDKNSIQKLFDILQHIALPILTIMYSSLAAQTRLSRTAILEVMHQDYVRTARAKGASLRKTLIHHIGRNAAIPIVTSLAGSLGIILGGSLIVETLFEINGFGKFFYDAVINRDYNVIMFSTLAGSFLALIGYLIADIAYMFLDPRITLE